MPCLYTMNNDIIHNRPTLMIYPSDVTFFDPYAAASTALCVLCK